MENKNIICIANFATTELPDVKKKYKVGVLKSVLCQENQLVGNEFKKMFS